MKHPIAGISAKEIARPVTKDTPICASELAYHEREARAVEKRSALAANACPGLSRHSDLAARDKFRDPLPLGTFFSLLCEADVLFFPKLCLLNCSLLSRVRLVDAATALSYRQLECQLDYSVMRNGVVPRCVSWRLASVAEVNSMASWLY